MVKKMKETTFADGLGHIDGDIVDRFVEMDERLHKKSIKKKTNGGVRLSKWALVAACLCIMVVTAVSTALITRAIKEQPTYNTIEVSEKLIDVIKLYMDQLKAKVEVGSNEIIFTMYRIANGEQPLHIEFDPQNYYFACAYLKASDVKEHHHNFYDYCCKDKYIWVGFLNETDIPEYYNGAKFERAFQINKTVFCKDILSLDNAVPTVEYIQQYKPSFDNGLNTVPANELDISFIYLNDSDDDCLYYCYDRRVDEHTSSKQSCVLIDGEYYIQYYVPSLGNDFLKDHFGDWYEYLSGIMITDTYDKNASPYIIFKIDDFSSIFKESDGG